MSHPTKKSSAAPPPKRASAWRRWSSILLIVPLVLFSWLTVFPAPTTTLWIASIFYIEMGHILALVLLVGCLLVDRSNWRGRALSVLGILGIGLLLIPWAQAVGFALQMTQDLQGLFGKQSALTAEKAPGQTTPLMYQRLLGAKNPGVKRTSYPIKVATGESLSLNMYQRRLGKKAQPLLVVIHGGAWRSRETRGVSSLNSYFAARGLSVADITYRLAPKYRFPAQLHDVKQMIQWLRSHSKKLRIDPNRIALLGRSAGAHLALLAGFKKITPGIRAIISFYGPTDLNWSWKNPSNPWVINSPLVLRNFLGGAPKQVQKNFDAASPIQFVTAKAPPTLLIQGKRDEVVSYKHGRRLAEQLKKKGVPHYLLELPWATHGCDIISSGPSGQISTYAIERFLQATLLR